jgi:DNA replication and repair protein RecF
MKIKEITLKSFRNYTNQSIKPHPRFNILSGGNGQGKTNFLEAIYYVGALRSFRGQNPRELLRWNTMTSILSAHVEREGPGIIRELAVEINPKGRRFLVNGKTPRSVGDYAQELTLVVFVPDDVTVARSSPDIRRKFLDRAVFGAEPAHLGDTLSYSKALKSRNALLKDRDPNFDILDVFDDTLSSIGARLIVRRKRFLQKFLPLFREVHIRFAPSSQEVGYQYRGPEGETEDEIAAELKDAFTKGRERDLKLKSTGSGPHTDDLIFTIQKRPIKHVGSQGEQRTVVLAWKIAEIHFLQRERNERPILLLDDVSSELDHDRSGRFFSYVQETEGQVFLTTTDAKHVPLEVSPEHRLDFHVRAGSITRLGEEPRPQLTAEEIVAMAMRETMPEEEPPPIEPPLAARIADEHQEDHEDEEEGEE